jgi:hypothetical protein
MIGLCFRTDMVEKRGRKGAGIGRKGPLGRRRKAAEGSLKMRFRN